MIGHLVRACEEGRRDARAGRRRTCAEFMQSRPERRAHGEGSTTWEHYIDGWRREREIMALEGALPQLELDLGRPHRKGLAFRDDSAMLPVGS